MRKCLDCSYQGKLFSDGECPGCGSRNIRSTSIKPAKQLKARKPYRLIFCLVLWVYLINEIFRRLS